MIKAIVFDMDGTILNTLDDLADAVNYALQERGHRYGYDQDVVRLFFGSGIRVAFERALAIEKGCPLEELEQIGTDSYGGRYKADAGQQEEIASLMEIYLPYYNAHCRDKTRPYEGILDLLRALRTQNIKMAVVSNKPDAAVKILCKDLFPGLFDFELGETAGIKRKPDRAMVDMCLNALEVDREEAIYVGDSEIDLLTARNSEMPCIAVTWGFRGRSFLEKHGASIIVEKPEEINKKVKLEGVLHEERL